MKKTKPAKSRGRPAHKPTDASRRQVEMMAAFGNTEEQIGQILGISDRTVRLHYTAEIAYGHVKANNAVAMNLWRQAVKDDPRAVPAAQFWLKSRAGWSEFAPAPPEKPRPLGKKEEASFAAQSAEEGTGWGDVLH